jgi:hypothetical protein
MGRRSMTLRAGPECRGALWTRAGRDAMPGAMSRSSDQRRRKRAPKPDRRRALELLAASHDGATQAIMLAHRFTVEQLVELIRAGLATATAERVVAGRHTVEVARVRITEAGRRALKAATRP